MCIIPLGPSLKEDLHGVLVDQVLGEQDEARHFIEEDDDADKAVKALSKAVLNMEQQILDLQEKIGRTKQAAAIIELRTTNGGHVAVD